MAEPVPPPKAPIASPPLIDLSKAPSSMETRAATWKAKP
jgi:hypothetical protein